MLKLHLSKYWFAENLNEENNKMTDNNSNNKNNNLGEDKYSGLLGVLIFTIFMIVAMVVLMHFKP